MPELFFVVFIAVKSWPMNCSGNWSVHQPGLVVPRCVRYDVTNWPLVWQHDSWIQRANRISSQQVRSEEIMGQNHTDSGCERLCRTLLPPGLSLTIWFLTLYWQMDGQNDCLHHCGWRLLRTVHLMSVVFSNGRSSVFSDLSGSQTDLHSNYYYKINSFVSNLKYLDSRFWTDAFL